MSKQKANILRKALVLLFTGAITALAGISIHTQIVSAGAEALPNPNNPLYARQTRNINLTFDGNGGYPAEQMLSEIASSSLAAFPEPPTRPGYTFIGWWTTAEMTNMGQRIAAPLTVPNANTTYWAWWVRNLTINYEVLVNVNTDDGRSHADAIMYDEIAPLFLEAFGVELVQVPGSPRYEPLLNNVPIIQETYDTRNGSNLLDIGRSSRDTIRFRFVNFQLFTIHPIRGLARQMHGLNGAHLGDMVVRTHSGPATPVSPHELRYTVIHEISHIFGAIDCVGGTKVGCIMGLYNPYREDFIWCSFCTRRIAIYLNNRVESHPELIRE